MKNAEAQEKRHQLHTDRLGNPSHYVSGNVEKAAKRIQGFFRHVVGVKKDERAKNLTPDLIIKNLAI